MTFSFLAIAPAARRAGAQTQALTAIVRDAGRALALSGVQVLIDHRAVSDTTNAEGIARVASVPTGRHLVS
ncbi:MAG: hypothetical protein KGL38_12600, partial [Gemmatimonadota bacterium]|nr:hypothetical protein [Gemmatimonadota bacterium]